MVDEDCKIVAKIVHGGGLIKFVASSVDTRTFFTNNFTNAHGSLLYMHSYTQNCLEDYAIKVAVQKIEEIDNSRPQHDNVFSYESLSVLTQSEDHTRPLFFSSV